MILEVGRPGSPRVHHSAISGNITVAAYMYLGRTLYIMQDAPACTAAARVD